MKAQIELPNASSHLRVREAPVASLGNWRSIENKEQRRPQTSFLVNEFHEFFAVLHQVTC